MHGTIFDEHFLIFSLKFSTNNCFVFFIRRIFLYPAKGKDIVRVRKTDQSPLAMKVFPNWVSNKKGFTFARPISLSLSLTRTHYLSWTLILLLSLSLSSLRHSILSLGSRHSFSLTHSTHTHSLFHPRTHEHTYAHTLRQWRSCSSTSLELGVKISFQFFWFI